MGGGAEDVLMTCLSSQVLCRVYLLSEFSINQRKEGKKGATCSVALMFQLCCHSVDRIQDPSSPFPGSLSQSLATSAKS